MLGVRHLPDAQIAFVDTPGLHRGHARALNRAMNRTAAAALEDADLAVLVLEAGHWTEDDEHVLDRIRRAGRKTLAAVNKVDRLRSRERLRPYLAELARRHEFAEIVPLSALKGHNVDALARAIAKHLPESPPLFPAEQVTDRGRDFRIAETIREKLTLELDREVIGRAHV